MQKLEAALALVAITPFAAAPVAAATPLPTRLQGSPNQGKHPEKFQEKPGPRTYSIEAPDLARRVTGPLIYFHCGDVKEFDARLENWSIAKLCNDPEMWDFLKTNPEIAKCESIDPKNKMSAPIMAWYGEQLKDAGIPDEVWKGFLDLCQSGFGLGEMSFAMTPPAGAYAPGTRERAEAREMPGFFWHMKTGDKPETFDTFVKSMVDFVKSAGGEEMARKSAFDNLSFYEFGNHGEDSGNDHEPIFCVARKATNVYLTAPKAETMVRLLGSAPSAPFADEPNFREAHDFFASNKSAMYLYVDGPRLLQTSRGTKKELQRMGMDQLRWIGMSMEPDGECLRHRLEVRANVTSGFPTLFTSKDRFDLASYLPERTVACVQMALDGPATVQAIRKIAAQYGPEEVASFDREMAQMRARVGTDIPELLGLLGNELALAVVPPESGFIPDFYLVAKAKDEGAAARIRELIEFAARDRKLGGEVRESIYQEYKITYAQVTDGPFYPAVLTDKDRIVLGSNLPAIKRYVQFLKGGSQPLATRKGFRDAIGSVATGPATGYLFIDWPAIARFTYGNFASIAPVLLGSVGEDLASEDEDAKDPQHPGAPKHPSREPRMNFKGLQFDWSKLPTSDTITKYIPPQAVRVRIGNQGLSLDSRAFF